MLAVHIARSEVLDFLPSECFVPLPRVMRTM